MLFVGEPLPVASQLGLTPKNLEAFKRFSPSIVFDLPLSQSLTEGGLTPTARARSTPLIFLGGKTSMAYLSRSARVFIQQSSQC